MKLLLDRCVRAPLAALSIALVLSGPLRAHNEAVHQNMTDLAYEIMLGTKSNPLSPFLDLSPPPGVPALEWNAFLASVRAAPAKLRQMNSDLPPKTLTCDGAAPLNLGWSQKPLGQVEHAVIPHYMTAIKSCGAKVGWAPGGIYNASNPEDSNGKRDYTGNIIGLWADAVDAEVDDTHLWIRPTSVGGQGLIKDTVDDAIDLGFGALLIPFVCLWEFLFGDASTCDVDAMNLADKANPLDDIEGLIPGVGDISGDMFVGMWHHIKMMGPGASNENDDRQGLLFEEAGPYGLPDPLDFTMMAAFDVAGMSVNHDKSLGTGRYQITGSDDGQPDTKVRSKSQWQFTTITHTPFEPVDNLGLFGWRKFRTEAAHSVKFLGWPLHAIGDATVPQHVAATSAWGHRPFEDAQEILWSSIRLQDGTTAEQKAQARAALIRAFEWRRLILAWRALDPVNRANDVPVRHLVTVLAQNTANFAAAQPAGWPFHPSASTDYLFDRYAAIRIYRDHPNAPA
ncbi:MAG: hypothetical protein H7Y20_04890, partial [Bryobacteraceae bacterium]|nr:hypothetical protein [Bryobacteraceae bacterium]